MRYENYSIGICQDGVYSAFKERAAKVCGITFSHHFYFQYCCESHDDDYINGRACVPFKPSLNDNYFQANVKGGVILSTDLKTFVFQDSSLDYVNWKQISKDELKNYENEYKVL